MYTSPNFTTKKALKAAIKAGHTVTVFQPGPFGDNVPGEGEISVEGPHFPKPHTWYARVKLVQGAIAKVIS